MENPDVDLAYLLGRLEFTDERAYCRSSDRWIVYAHPWLRDKPDVFDALITITDREGAPAAVEGLGLTLRRHNIVWLTGEAVNKRGQIWFRELPKGEFRLTVHKLDAQARVRAGGAALAAKAPRDVAAKPGLRWQIYHAADRRIEAVLEECTPKKTNLTVRTRENALAGARIRLEFAPETEEMTFNLTPEGDLFVGGCLLDAPFEVLASRLPRLDVVASA